MIEIDMRNQKSPIPLLETKMKIMELTKDEKLVVIINSKISLENIKTMLLEEELVFKETYDNSGDIYIEIIKDKAKENLGQSYICMIGSTSIGCGSDALGNSLLKSYLGTLVGLSDKPDKIILYNEGVQIAGRDSNCIKELKELENSGVRVLSSSACLKYYGIQSKLDVGIITDMFNIVNSQIQAKKVIMLK